MKLGLRIRVASQQRSTIIYSTSVSTQQEEIKPKTKKKNENVVRKNFNFAIPYHPYVICFNTLTDAHVKIHVNNLEEYKYDASLRQKLILPDDDSELLDLLCSSTQDLSEDIISGKSGGIMVLGTGIAGSGKTLTAEVFSEFMARPLYKIQSSQLGIDVKELDKRLRKILQRAIRWNAILLVDEADVYIRSRGTDIEQNAVVGVFLRLLEYFSGIIFLTSNLTDTDDAIMSRATAHIKYTYPTSDNLRKIWEILTEQYQVKITKDIVDQFCTSIDNKMVGRDVKNISKLAKIYSSKQKVIDLETLKKIAKFKDLGDKLEKK
jgi:SpoVK/Ycf46/Vps4 family AAA+-type ATPase